MRNVAQISVALALLANACGGRSSSETAPAATAPSAKAPATTPPAPAPAPTPKPEAIVVAGVGLAQPESVLHDPADDVYLVSNIDGKPLDKDGNGFISRIKPDGTVEALRFIAGGKQGAKLNAPKGMAIAGDELYVADIDEVRVFDRKSGAPKRSVAVKGATFLNDVAVAADGSVYVTDSGLEQWGAYIEPNGKDAVHRLEGKRASAIASGKALGNPNGVLVDARGLLVVNKTGELLRLDGAGNRGEVVKLPKGSLDGIVQTENGLLISSWDAKAVLAQRPDGSVQPIVEKVASPADIGYDGKRKRVLIPVLTESVLRIEAL
jgi:sugar lactone lactonase YvrE